MSPPPPHGNGHDLVEVAKERVCGLLSLFLARCNSYNILARGLPPLLLLSAVAAAAAEAGREEGNGNASATGSVAPAPTLVRTTSEGAFLKGETGGPDIVEASR